MGTYLNFDDSKTIFSGRTVKSSFIWAWSTSGPSGVTKHCEKFLYFSGCFWPKGTHSIFFLKICVLLLGPGLGSAAQLSFNYLTIFKQVFRKFLQCWSVWWLSTNLTLIPKKNFKYEEDFPAEHSYNSFVIFWSERTAGDHRSKLR